MSLLTRREKIVKILIDADRPLSVEEIGLMLRLPRGETKQLYDEIRHASRSLQRKTGGRLAIVMLPPKCTKCGFVFRNLKRPRKPSKCPRCKSERIESPKFTVRELF